MLNFTCRLQLIPLCYIMASMFILPYKLLTIELKRSNCWKQYIIYERHLSKLENNKLRIKFLETCKRSDIVPKFLKFRIPSNGCFRDETVHKFQI